MKKIITLLSATAIILFFLTSCDKYHRDRYTGTWNFVTERVYYNENHETYQLVEVKRDTVFYTGKISCGNWERVLVVQYTENENVDTWIDKDGYIFSKAGDMLGKYSSGEFESKNKMYLNLYWGNFVIFEGETDRRYDFIKGTKKGRR